MQPPTYTVTPQPAAAPSGRTALTLTTGAVATRHRIYTYGDDDRIPNPGDMLIVSVIADGPIRLEVATLIRGREVGRFAEAALTCAADYDANADWLSAPVTRYREGAA